MAENVEKKKFGAKVKGLFGELKKVTWPTFGKVVSQTGVVLVVTLFFLLVLMGMDAGLQQLYKLLVSGLGESSAAVLPIVTQPAATVLQAFGALTPLGL
jgi:preprotein translocase SecE subunit